MAIRPSPSPSNSTGKSASASSSELLRQAQSALDQSQWAKAQTLFGQALRMCAPSATPLRASILHNLSLAALGLGQHAQALTLAQEAKRAQPELWQSAWVMGQSLKGLGHMEQALSCFEAITRTRPGEPQALVAMADLYMNQFGHPLLAKSLVQPLLKDPQYFAEATLTWLMASLYDREPQEDAQTLSRWAQAFAQKHLQLEQGLWPHRSFRAGVLEGQARPRVGIISPLFCVSPVYFLTIHGLRHIAKGSDVIVFDRGHKKDWATEAIAELASEWVSVQELPAEGLSARLFEADLDVLYDLGGWMDAVALKALSAKPARKMYKWVGGQSLTTGLRVFDGWIGDPWQSPLRLQSLYAEPIINVEAGYATYTPPEYLPRVKAGQTRRDQAVIFANPAKLSRAFLANVRSRGEPVVFMHQQFKWAGVQQRITQSLGDCPHEFVMPSSHQEALERLSEYATMLDTYPYSGGLTVREARALGLKIKGQVGELFCERHSAQWLA